METKGYELIRLPIYKNEPRDIRQLVSRNFNSKGEFTRLAVDEINYLAYIDFKVGMALRANHYHQKKDKYLYICKGIIKGYFKIRAEKNAVKEHIIEEGTLIHILPDCVHAFETIEEGHDIEFSPTQYKSMEEDVFSYDLMNVKKHIHIEC